ncbi:Mob1/phocein [Boletus reticuloceps]|uniref:Mob1/phocein n=1 Tax=Boletus reticuloceps TaxID=495285 RepID=A0A8I2YW07_9AGAM|nr:Mob1/phocein [Boletus reticuloceps]
MTTQVLQRPYRGSRVSSFYPVKSLPPLSSLDSAFQLQEYISLLIRLDVHDVDAIVDLPGKPAPKDHDETLDPSEPDTKKPEDADRKSDISVDRACWIYEQLRRLAQDLSHPLITMLQQECTRSSCPQMKAGEWLYLCVAHGNDGAMEQCCAIDYILHTVDSATALLNSPRAFPSRHHTGTFLLLPVGLAEFLLMPISTIGRPLSKPKPNHPYMPASSNSLANFIWSPQNFSSSRKAPSITDDNTHIEQVEPPRLLSVAVHPTPSIQDDELTVDTAPEGGLASSSRPIAVDTANQFGTDSPRRLGRNRTDTMVFSEAFSVADELSRSEDGGTSTAGSLPGNSPMAETRSLASEQSLVSSPDNNGGFGR